MGIRYDLTCPGCGYRAEVSGGQDCGIAAVVTTIRCQDCRTLRDVEVGEFGQVTQEPHCPRCQTPIPQGEMTVLWD